MRLRFLAVHGPLLAACALLASSPLLASSTTFWLVSTQTDFLKGEVDQLSIDSDGRVTLGPAVDLLHEADTPAIWRLLVDNAGEVWAGTGNTGRVLRIDRAGKATTALDATELDVHALAFAPDGAVYAGSSPDGKVYRIPKTGAAAPFFDPEDKYIWAVTVGRDGQVYAATGEKGKIYKIGPDGKGTLFYDAGATHVMTLAWDKSGALLAGTSSPARVVRLDEKGKPFVLLESSLKEIRSIRVHPTSGVIYAAAIGASGADATVDTSSDKPSTDTSTGVIPMVSTEVTITAIGDAVVSPTPIAKSDSRGSGKGAVYRILPDGMWDEVWTSAEDAPYDLAIGPNDDLLVATGNKGKLFRLWGNPTVVTLVTRAVSQQATTLAQDATGRVYYATSNPGKILRLSAGRAERGSYLSDVKDTSTVSTWGAIRWNAVTPSGTRVELQTRSGNTKTPDQTWSDWSKSYTQFQGEPIASPKARYVQWKATLIGAKETPVLTSVTTAYLPRNSRPALDPITVHPPGIAFQRPYPTGDPEIAGFDAGTSDGKSSAASSTAGAFGLATTPTLGRRTFQKSLQTFVWRGEDDDDDKLQYDVWYRREGDASWKALKRGLWDGIYTWDTTAVPDGTYTIKIVASDAPSNAPESTLSVERESAAFQIDNTPPMIEVSAGSPTRVTFVVRDNHSPIQRVEYSTNAGGWKLLYPVDGLLDSREERFELSQNDAPLEATVVRATDSLGNASTSVLRVPTPK